jgi:DNA-binding transcriptional regulator YdaS (Cro superfamily)
MAYWEIGRLIIEEEQQGKDRAEYGKALLKELSTRLTADYGKGFTITNLKYFRKFYLLFSPPLAEYQSSTKRDSASLTFSAEIGHALSDQSNGVEKGHAVRAELLEKAHTPRGESVVSQKSAALRPELSWTHYRLLLKAKDEEARLWYMNEAADCGCT